MKIALGADHLGYPLKEAVKRQLEGDYPDVAVEVARAVAGGTFGRAILVCGTGIGMAITANKVPGVRAATVADPYSAERARKSNDAQVLCLGARVVPPELAAIIVEHWLASEFQGGDSAGKVAKIEALDVSRRGRVEPAGSKE